MPTFIQPDIRNAPRRAQVLEVLAAALEAADPAAAIQRVMQRSGDRLTVAECTYDLNAFRRVFVVGAGKAGAAMSQAVERILGDRLTAGRVTVKEGHTAPVERIRLHEAAHPVPDAAGMAGAQAIVDLLRDTRPDDLVICLLSGGGSALLSLPAAGIELHEVQALTQALLRSGAPIQDLNAVRKHLSRVKGGQLARLAHPATVVALILSDVVGSPLDVIASGPMVADTSTFVDADAVLRRYLDPAQVPPAIRRHIDAGTAGHAPETVKPGDSVLANVQNVLIADNRRAAQAAAAHAEALGFRAQVLTTFLEGEAREIALVLAALAKEICASGAPLPAPACLILGGETTVTVTGEGRGGRNQEMALAAALAIDGLADVVIACLATDGTDGPTDSAGGIVDGTTVQRGDARGLSARAALDNNDAYPFLAAVGDQLVTGPTGTNVNDLAVVFVFAPGEQAG